eukprot:15362655-Ditylum_brightwellii.AAC.1
MMPKMVPVCIVALCKCNEIIYIYSIVCKDVMKIGRRQVGTQGAQLLLVVTSWQAQHSLFIRQ